MISHNNKKLKNLFFAILTMFLGLNINTVKAHHFSNYYGIEMNVDEYMTLLNLGFTDNEIYYMDEDTFNENKDLDSQLITQNQKYYKIINPMYGTSYVTEVTASEYFNQPENQLLDTVTTEFFTEISSISANGAKYRYKNSVSWSNIPLTKSYDIMGIGFINSVYINSLIYNKYSYADSSGVWHNSTLYYDKKNTSTGGSFVYKIPNELYGLSSMIYFDVSKNTTDTLQYITMCGDYAHSLQTVTQSEAASHYVNSGGVSFNNYVLNYYSEIPCAYSTAEVNW